MGSQWWTRRAVLLHITLAVLLPVFTGLFLWQVERALSGNELSWAYVFEWPFFGAYAIYLWWRLVHEPPETSDGSPEPREEPLMTTDTSRSARNGTAAPERVATVTRGAPPATANRRGTERSARREAAREEQARREEEELAAYNRYLARLHARDEPEH